MFADAWSIWGLIGIVSGCVLGLAGAGGGIIGIPMLIYLAGYSVKAASGYALLVISVGAALTWYPQRKNTHYLVTITLLIFAFIGAHFTAPLKAMAPSWLVILLLNAACAFSLYSLWIMKVPTPIESEKNSPFFAISRSSLGGVFTGALSTMTGLGGGIIMVPWLTAINRLKLAQAVASSLLTIAISAPYSAYVQGYIDLDWKNFAALILGSTIAAFAIKASMVAFSPRLMNWLRKGVLTSVIIISMITTLIKLF